MNYKRRIGIVGYGHLGEYLVDEILARPADYELAFVWTRSGTFNPATKRLDRSVLLEDLTYFYTRRPDLVVEVAHPTISKAYGEHFLKHCDYMIGSPTALADPETEVKLRRAARKPHGLYVPSGAMWGLEDIRKMADRGTLQGLTVTMRQHPNNLKLVEGSSLRAKNDNVSTRPIVLYEGPVRDLCHIAPNNVNTMAAAAMAAHNLGFDKTQACLISDPNMTDYHVTEIAVQGPSEIDGRTFTVRTTRTNPSCKGEVTAKATYSSFLSSLLAAEGKGPGVHLC